MIEETIYKVLREIQERNSYPAIDITENTRVVRQLGFSSLDVAELIAVLEMELGVDPFSNGVSIMSVETVGDLRRVYSQMLEPEIV